MPFFDTNSGAPSDAATRRSSGAANGALSVMSSTDDAGDAGNEQSDELNGVCARMRCARAVVVSGSVTVEYL